MVRGGSIYFEMGVPEKGGVTGFYLLISAKNLPEIYKIFNEKTGFNP